MELVDTHCHLDVGPLGADPDGVLERARAAGVTRVVVPAYDPASWEPVAALARRPGVFPAFGLHPWAAAAPLDLEGLAARLRGGAVAIGEIGLDFQIPAADRDRQLAVLTAQLDLAVDLDLPVLLHCRGAFEELASVVRRHAPSLRGVFHAFSRGPELAERFVGLGLHVAFGGAITRPRARVQRALAKVPLERLVLETDAPSIGLERIPKEATEPRHVREVAEVVAGLKGLPVETLARITTDNAVSLLGLE